MAKTNKKETFFNKPFTTNWGEVIRYGLLVIGFIGSVIGFYYAFINMEEKVELAHLKANDSYEIADDNRVEIEKIHLMMPKNFGGKEMNDKNNGFIGVKRDSSGGGLTRGVADTIDFEIDSLIKE